MGVMKRNYFQIGEISSLDFGVVISSADVFGSPKRVYEEVAIPGRNGSILFDEGYYDNVKVTYECQLINQDREMDDFRAWIMSQTGYVRIEDTYHPQEFRIGYVDGEVSGEMSGWNLRHGSFRVTFSCKPQRFLKTGEVGTEYVNNFTIFNPTYYEAKPKFRIFGRGTLGIGSYNIVIANHSLEYIDIDCAVGDCYCGAVNANQYITLSGSEYPGLASGATNITLDSHMTSIILYPGWWTL